MTQERLFPAIQNNGRGLPWPRTKRVHVIFFETKFSLAPIGVQTSPRSGLRCASSAGRGWRRRHRWSSGYRPASISNRPLPCAQPLQRLSRRTGRRVRKALAHLIAGSRVLAGGSEDRVNAPCGGMVSRSKINLVRCEFWLIRKICGRGGPVRISNVPDMK